MNFRVLPYQGGSPREISEVVNNIMNGKTNNTGSVTIATGGATTTTITDARIGGDSVVILVPTSQTAASQEFPYGSFSSTADQTIASTTTAYAMTYNTTDFSDGVSVSNNSRLVAGYSGIYNLQFSAQLLNANVQIQDASIWFRKNGTDIANSNSQFSVPNSHGGVDGALIAALNLYVDLQKDQYVEIMWSATSTDVSLQAIPTQSSPTRPATPSVIATMCYVSTNGYTSNIYFDPFVSATANGSATISHAPNTIAGKTLDYVIVG
jgi:hypothetical protein